MLYTSKHKNYNRVYKICVRVRKKGDMLTNLLLAEDRSEIMQKALFPDQNINFLGVMVGPSFISALIVAGIIIIAAILIRVIAIPRFKKIPGKFQSLLEALVSYFDNLANTNSPHHPSFVGAYIFAAGVYIFFGIMIEMIGFRAVLGDLNSCIMMGFTSYLVIMGGGLVHNKVKGVLGTLKDFSLPFSMSFRLFGAVTSGVVVSALIYEAFIVISYTIVVPILVSLLFTVLHAVVQAYVLTLLVSIFFGSVTAPKVKVPKEHKNKKAKQKI